MQEYYAFEYTPKIITFVLYSINELREDAYMGKFENVFLTLIEIEQAIDEVTTERQKEVIYLTFYCGYKQENVAKKLGISQQAVRDAIKHTADKVARYLNNERLSKNVNKSRPGKKKKAS